MAAVQNKDYSSLQDIREEAGHQHLNRFEELTGVKDGNNTLYTAKRTYIVDSNYNDTLDVMTASGDVIVYVNDVAVQVSAVDANTGGITLSNAPASGASVLGTYYHSALNDTKVEKYRKEAIDYVQRKLRGIIDYSTWEDSTIPQSVVTVVRLYAAGLILIRDHGLNADTENTSKDGYKKLSTAKSLLKEYIEEVEGASGSTARVSATGRSDGNIFPRNSDLTNSYPETTDRTEDFMRS